MCNVIRLFIVTLMFVTVTSAQELSREQKLQRVFDLDAEVKNSINEYLAPDAGDRNEAAKIGAEVFRIMPRGKIDSLVGIRGGGAYYSFSAKSHDYNDNPQIELQQDNLSVGFAGADYGFIVNLGDIPLSGINMETNAVSFLADYRSPEIMPEIRNEQRKSRDYQANGITYKRELPAIVGNSYVLRSVSSRETDALVAFMIYRKDADGSLIIFWKMLKEFEKPLLADTNGK